MITYVNLHSLIQIINKIEAKRYMYIYCLQPCSFNNAVNHPNQNYVFAQYTPTHNRTSLPLYYYVTPSDIYIQLLPPMYLATSLVQTPHPCSPSDPHFLAQTPSRYLFSIPPPPALISRISLRGCSDQALLCCSYCAETARTAAISAPTAVAASATAAAFETYTAVSVLTWKYCCWCCKCQ